MCSAGKSTAFTILSAVAEAERDRTRERIAQVKADQRERSRFLGGTRPFGYQIAADGELVEDAGEQKAIARMCELRGHGLSLRAIAEALADDGIALSQVGREEGSGAQRRQRKERA
ncbi:hypothetical protein [Mesorhizobium sp.]|uniref:hypothetical protein n=1 Tax=Mesorhizobium sp. TaxID=1871066 RepID=UPI0025796F23|nr:hypothetical protein [Mesorhizobium sp.]